MSSGSSKGVAFCRYGGLMDPKQAPIYSSREDSPELEDEISDFVIGLAEEIDCLQDYEACGDFRRVEELCRDLADRAQKYGYDMLAEVAFVVGDACREQKPDSVQHALVELTDLGRRVRRGHRGAA